MCVRSSIHTCIHMHIYVQTYTPLHTGSRSCPVYPRFTHCPLLFILYINDLVNHVDSWEISLYTGDSQLFREIMSVCASGVRPDLKLNADKCCILTFTNKKECLSFQYIILSQSLPRVTGNFKEHIIRNVSKVFKMCCFIKRVCTTF